MLRATTFERVVGKVGLGAKGDIKEIKSFIWFVWSGGHYRSLAEW